MFDSKGRAYSIDSFKSVSSAKKEIAFENVKFQQQHSRNSHDWNFKKQNGRFVLRSTGGVELRAAIILEFIAKNPKVNQVDILFHLKTVSRSYTKADLARPLQVLIKHELISSYINKNGVKVFFARKKGLVLLDCNCYKP